MGLDFNFQVPNEEEAKEFVSEDEVDPGVFSDTPSSVPLLVKPRLALPSRLLGLHLLTCMTWRLSLLRLLVALPQNLGPFV